MGTGFREPMARGFGSALLAAWLAACGGNVDGESPAPGAAGAAGAGGESGQAAPLALADFEQTLTDAICVAMNDCCTNAGLPATTSCNEAAAAFAKFLAADSSRYDASVARRCVDAYAKNARACSSSLITPEVEAACAPLHDLTLIETVMGGKRVGLGATCDTTCNAAECSVVAEADHYSVCSRHQDGLWCGWNQTCEPVARVGEPCSRPWSCEDGAVCDSQSCRRLVDTLGACSESWQCAWRDICKDGTCQPRTVVDSGACGN